MKLISSDGHTFIIKKEYAMASKTIAAMMCGPGVVKDGEINEIKFRNIS